MPYEPTNWKSGDVVTSAKLNKMEGGIENASLPAVTESDNGDVLTVVEGAWAKADPPSSLPAVTGADNGNVLTVVEGRWAKVHSNALIIPLEYDDVTDYLTSTKTFKEIQDAISAGIVCYFYDHAQDASQRIECLYPIIGTNYSNSTYEVNALGVNVSEGTPIVFVFTTDSENGYPYVED